ncbi:gluconeogenesis factor YvcK family protein [Ornithinimicrobium cryptoxanthini]|uniref:Putative gluconeogenesis factor n=1 Tax=Ornithinimicrobium cryptoxanthini TaxID=2934161 RepID=A0ABY4YEZ6_9MICO|nr:uridine diphosphate-N-acetylglucosamine-binding protein YvcK [Ornithinimicrobium cryptoxanthini]USQ74928.1 uridine diphosphate-N-acetylglucosamine-binding protein YvcK [Ornithinimicrobium cryptoxanthini]
MSGPRVVALGGGHGLAASLQALRHLTEEITAVVTVADDGGSSGRLRDEFGILPPGDLRMALAALCEDTAWGHQWSAVLQHRLGGGGELAGHALGNLLIMGLWELLDSPIGGLDLVGRLLNTRGRVLPMCEVPLEIEATVLGAEPEQPQEISVVKGQSRVAATPGRVMSVCLVPDEPPASEPALEAIKLADFVILGPGSWFTSVMPHLLVPDLRDALVHTPARRILTLNVGMDDDETQGFSPAEHIEVLSAHAPDLTVDYVIADPAVVRPDEDGLREVAQGIGAELVVTPVRKMRRPREHDTLRLAAAYRDVILGG